MAAYPTKDQIDAMPTIVTGPGEYQTRDGRKAVIREVSPGLKTFAAVGGIEQFFRGRAKVRGHHLWNEKGHYDASGNHKLDLIGIWPRKGDETIH